MNRSHCVSSIALAFLLMLPRTVLGLAQQGAAASPTLRPEIGALEGIEEDVEGKVFAFGVVARNPTDEVLTYRWDFGDGSQPLEVDGRSAITHYYMRDSTYQVRLGVRGNRGFAAARSLDVTVHNAKPEIRHLYHDPTRLLGEPFPFKAEVFDPGDDELMYIWDYGDGTPPDSGVAMRRVSHRYAKKGTYTLTLTVRDESYDPDLRHTVVESIAVEVMPAWTATVSGALQMDLEGDVAQPPMPSAPLAPLTTAGVCHFNKGLWDEASKTVIPFVWHVSLDSLLETRVFGVRYSETMAKTFGAEQATFAMTLLGIDPGYQLLRAQWAARPGLPAPGAIAGPLNPRIAPGAPVGGSGRNWTFLSDDGVFQVEAITEDRLKAAFDVNLTGQWQDASGNASPVGSQQIQVKGKLVWRFNAQERVNFAICQDKPFEIESHDPAIEERNVDFEDPEVRLTFTYPFRPQTVNDRTFRIGYLKPGGTFQPIAGRRSFSPDGMTVYFHAAGDTLMDAVFYHVKLTGGKNGILGLGNQELPDEYEWRFGTIPKLVPEVGGVAGFDDGRDFGSNPRPMDHGPSGFDGEGTASARGPTAQATYNVCGRPTGVTDPEDIQVYVHVFQTACDAVLLPGKEAVVRVYADWEKKSSVDDRSQVEAFEAKVIIRVNRGGESPVVDELYHRFVRRDLHAKYKIRTRQSQHTANSRWTPERADTKAILALVKPTHVTTAFEFEPGSKRAMVGWRPFKFWAVEDPAILEFNLYFAQVEEWEEESPENKKAWDAFEKRIAAGLDFVTANLPVHSTRIGEVSPLPNISMHVSVDHPCLNNPRLTCRKYFLPTLTMTPVPVSRAHALILQYYLALIWDSRPSVVVVPNGDEWRGVAGPNPALFRPMVMLEYNADFVTLAHEFVHYFGLWHDKGHHRIEGFRIEPRVVLFSGNKSFVEGNGQSTVLCSLMSGSTGLEALTGLWGRDAYADLCRAPDAKTRAERHFITNTQYDALLKSVPDRLEIAFGDPTGVPERLGFTPSEASNAGPRGPHARLDDVRRAIRTQTTSAQLIIAGFASRDGNSAVLLPLTRAPSSAHVPAPEGDAFSAELYDTNDRRLWSQAFDPGPIAQTADAAEQPAYPFVLAAPLLEGLARVAIRNPDGDLIGELRKSPNTPTVSFINPASGSVLSGRQQLRWRGADGDGDSLSYTLYYSADGSNWGLLATAYPADTLTIDTKRLVPGPSSLLRILATDGFDSVEDTVAVELRNDIVPLAVRPSAGDTAEVGAVTVMFRTDIDPAAINDETLSLRDQTGGQMAGTIDWDDGSRTLVFTPQEPLRPATAYMATLSPGLTDRYGNAVASPYSWSFQTAPDTLPPRVVRTFPSRYAITVFPEAEVQVQFSETMDAERITEGGIVLESAAGVRLPGSVTYDDSLRVAVFQPAEPLEVNTTYRATVTTNVADESGNALPAAWTWEFTTTGLVRPLRQ